MGCSGDGGPASAATLNAPWDLSIDRGGNLYIADFNSYRIRKINSMGIISTYAGTLWAGYTGEGGYATASLLNNPSVGGLGHVAYGKI